MLKRFSRSEVKVIEPNALFTQMDREPSTHHRPSVVCPVEAYRSIRCDGVASRLTCYFKKDYSYFGAVFVDA